MAAVWGLAAWQIALSAALGAAAAVALIDPARAARRVHPQPSPSPDMDWSRKQKGTING